jgi:hypothetical protein
VVSAAWSSERGRWTVTGTGDGQPVTLTCRFLYLCTGYYRYDGGHDPAFPGRQEFRGAGRGTSCVPVNADPRVTERPLLDFTSGYVQRSLHEFPKSGSRGPWQVVMSYPRDLLTLRYGRIGDGTLRFARRS